MEIERLGELIVALEAVKDLAENILDEMFGDPDANAMVEYLSKRTHDQVKSLMSELRNNKLLLEERGE